MEITNVIISNSFFDFVLKNRVLSFFLIIIFLAIIIIVGVIFYNFQTTEKGKFCVFVFFSILFTLSLCLFPFYVNFVPEVYDPVGVMTLIIGMVMISFIVFLMEEQINTL